MQVVFADPPFEDERVEGLLHLVAGPVEFVEEQAIGVVAGDHRGRAESAAAIDDLGHSDQVLWGQLRAEEADALQAQRRGEVTDQRRLPDSRLAPDEHRARDGNVQQHVG